MVTLSCLTTEPYLSMQSKKITLNESEIQSLARKICHIVINKGRKTFFQNKNNQKYYDSAEDKQDIVTIEKLLFREELCDEMMTTCNQESNGVA